MSRLATHFQITFGLAICFIAANGSFADTVVLNDNFSSGNTYSISSFNKSDPPDDNNPDDISFADFTLESSGGNPADYLKIGHHYDVNRDGNGDPLGGDGRTFVQSFLENETVSYNPASRDAFTSVSYSIDYRATDSFGSVYFSMGNGSSGSFRAFEPVITDGDWHTHTFTGLQADFSSYDFAGSEDLFFGFGFTSPEFDVSSGAVDQFMDVDNFVITVSPVPEPNSLFFCGILGLAILRRRRLKNRNKHF